MRSRRADRRLQQNVGPSIKDKGVLAPRVLNEESFIECVLAGPSSEDKLVNEGPDDITDYEDWAAVGAETLLQHGFDDSRSCVFGVENS
jgi:hypothetical protein